MEWKVSWLVVGVVSCWSVGWFAVWLVDSVVHGNGMMKIDWLVGCLIDLVK